MASYPSGITRPTVSVPSSNGTRSKSPKFMDMNDNNATDYSIFIGYGTNARRIKERWEATKRLLRFENNFAAFKWLLDSFVDEYLRSKQMDDTMTVTAGPSRKDRRLDEASFQGYGRRMAMRSPPKTRFEEVPSERHESGKVPARSPPAVSMAETRPPSSSKEYKSKSGGDSVRTITPGEKGYAHLPGQYAYKYYPEYWSPYYHWSGGVAVNPRLMNVSSIPGYPGYMIKTPSCSSLPTREAQGGGDSLKRWGSAAGVKDEAQGSEKQLKRPAVKLGFKTKSMPNLQFIPKESEGVSEDEDDVESDPESQGDLVALSSSSLSMPNLHKIHGERTPLFSPPSRGRYEPLLRDRHDACPSSSFSMPNLQAIQGGRADDRKKTIRDFVMNRLTKNDDGKDGVTTKIFNPNGYFMSARVHDSENKRVKQDIRRRLLQRIEAKRNIEGTHTDVSSKNKNERLTPHMKMMSKLPKISENRILRKKVPLDESAARGEARQMAEDDRINNNWKVPVTGVTSSDQSRVAKAISWDDDQAMKGHGQPESRIWNPADVHVKKENVSDDSVDGNDTAAGASTNGRSPQPVPTKASGVKDSENERASTGSQEEERKEGSSDDEENIDVETFKENDAVQDDSGESESELADDISADGKRNKRTRKPDHPKKRLKAM